MKNIICLLFLILIGCNKSEYGKNVVTENSAAKKVSYNDFLRSVKNKSETEKKNYFFTFINYDVPNYWMGTPWSFNGTTRNPQQESIACGYFVTNTLTDFGFEINRTYLAQQASSVMIKKLCKDIQYFTKRQDLEHYILKRNKNQVYIVGLDFHTGFITRENKDIYFIHSSYIKSKGVVKELTATSQALDASKTFMIGTLNY